jgi:hypothetical protein
MRLKAVGRQVDVHRWDVESTDEGVTLYGTVGASTRAHDVHRVEFVIGLLPMEDSVALSLAALATFPVLSGPVTVGETVTLPDPVIAGSAAHTYLVVPRKESILPQLGLGDGTHVEFLQVLPIHESELELKQRHSAEWLVSRIFDEGLRLSAPTRPPVKGA